MAKSALTGAAIIGGAFAATALLVGGIAIIGVTTSMAYVRSSNESVGPIALTFLAVWATAAAGAGTLGIIWHAIALQRGWTNVVAYVFAGLLLGAGLPAALTAPAWVSELLHPFPGEGLGAGLSVLAVLVGAILGPLTALFAWLIRRPDRDTPANLPTSAP